MPIRSTLSFMRTIFVLTVACAIPLLGDPTISVQPSTMSPMTGDHFTVDIVVSGVTDLYAYQFDFGFNPTIVAVDSVTEGPFLAEGGSTIFIPGTIDNVGGDVSNNADSLLTAISGVSGSGTLATFDLTALAPGSSSLSAFNSILLDSSLNGIDATVINASVTVSGAAVPEPRHASLIFCGALLLLICAPRRVLRRLGLLIAPMICLGQSFDTTPPTLVGFSFAPNAVNVTTGPQNVVVSLHVTDDLSGVLSGKAYVEVYFSSPSGKQYQVGFGSALAGSTPLNANFQATVTIPEFSESGNWTVSDVYLSDAVGNSTYLSTSALASMFFPTTLAVTSIPDTTPPTLAGLSIVPSSINVSNGPQAVTLSLHLTDAQSGVSFACQPFCYDVVGFTGPFGDEFVYVNQFAVQLASGTPNDGVWSVPVTFPRYAAAGTWTMTELFYQDAANNQVFLDSSQIQSLGFATSVNVSSVPSDSAPPVLKGFSISPLAVDTSTGPQTITLTLGLTDNLSGVDFFEVQFTSPSGQQYAYAFGQTLASGTPLNGQWQGSFVLPQYSEGGTWTVQYVYVLDNALNQLLLNGSSQLQADGYPTSFAVFKPSLQPDGSIGPTGGTVPDTVFGSRASVTLPANAVSGMTSVAIDVLSSGSPLAPSPTGFATSPATFFTNIVLNPEPNFPLSPPGGTLVLPLTSPMTPGTVLSLFYVNGLGSSVPVQSTNPPPINVQGTVDASGLSATFTNVSHFSTFVGYVPNPGTVFGDVNEDGLVNCKDIAIIKADFGKKKGQTGYNPLADLNNDGVINILDLAIDARLLPKGLTCP